MHCRSFFYRLPVLLQDSVVVQSFVRSASFRTENVHSSVLLQSVFVIHSSLHNNIKEASYAAAPAVVGIFPYQLAPALIHSIVIRHYNTIRTKKASYKPLKIDGFPVEFRTERNILIAEGEDDPLLHGLFTDI